MAAQEVSNGFCKIVTDCGIRATVVYGTFADSSCRLGGTGPFPNSVIPFENRPLVPFELGTLRGLTLLLSLGSVAQLGRSTPMMPDANRVEEAVELHDLAIKLRTAILYSIAQSLAAQFPPSAEPPPELRTILERLDKL